ncbi:MAG: hypothetical protein ABIW17_04270 [Marmoricola sp.]
MTTQDVGRELEPRPEKRTALEADAALGALFASSPARPVHTSAAAEIAFLGGLFGILAVPFSLMMALAAGLGALALVISIVGMARSSRPAVAGGVLAAVGFVLSLATLALVGLRYIGIDTAVGDSVVPWFDDWLRVLNDLLPKP